MIHSAVFEQHETRTMVRSRRDRRLGSLFPGLRRNYLFLQPLLLCAGAMECWLSGSDFGMFFAALLITVVGAYQMFDMVILRRPIRVSHVLSMTLSLGYGLGTVNSWLTIVRGNASLTDFMRLDQADTNTALAVVALAIALLTVVGEAFERPILGEEYLLRFNRHIIVFITLGTAIVGLAYMTGSLAFMGAAIQSQGEETNHVSVLGSLAFAIASPIFALSLVTTLNLPRSAMKLYSAILTIVLILMILPLGRRNLIFSVILALIALRVGKYKIPGSWMKKTVLLVALAGIVYVATIAFYYLRLAGFQLIKPTLGQRISAAWDYYQTTSYEDFSEKFSSNVHQRTFIIGFLSTLQGDVDTKPTGYGGDAAQQFEAVIPHALYADKNAFFIEEGYADDLFGEHFPDLANSIFSAGIIDFGDLGMLLYPVLLAILFRKYIEVLDRYTPSTVAFFVTLSLIIQLLQPEITLTAYFACLRTGIILVPVCWIVLSLPEVRANREKRV